MSGLPTPAEIEYWMNAPITPPFPGEVYRLMTAFANDELGTKEQWAENVDWENLDWNAAEAVIALSSHLTPTRPYIEAALRAAFGLEWDVPTDQLAPLGIPITSVKDSIALVPSDDGIETMACPETYAHYDHYWQRRRYYCPGVTE